MSEAVEPGKEVVNVEAEIEKQLSELKNRIGAPPSNKITTKGKKFALPSGSTSNGPLNVIILDWRWLLAHYPGKFNAKSPQDPDCFAVGINKPESGQLVPHESIAKPKAENCSVCPLNEWGSDPNGAGKACKNQLRLLVIAPDADDDTEPLTLYVSPTALKNFFAYASELASVHNLLVINVTTEISFDPNETYPKLCFKMGERHANINAMWALKTQYEDMVTRPIELKAKSA